MERSQKKVDRYEQRHQDESLPKARLERDFSLDFHNLCNVVIFNGAVYTNIQGKVKATDAMIKSGKFIGALNILHPFGKRCASDSSPD